MMNPFSETRKNDDDTLSSSSSSSSCSTSQSGPIDGDCGRQQRTQEQQQQQQQQTQQQQQPQHDERNNEPETEGEIVEVVDRTMIMDPPLLDGATINADSVYEFYVDHVFPAVMSSLPILLHRLWMDVMAGLAIAAHKFYLFLLPTWLRERYEHRQMLLAAATTTTSSIIMAGDDDGGGVNGTNSVMNGWLVSPNVLAQQLWEQIDSNIRGVNATIAEFMLHHFDVNKDGHISPHELVNMTELLARLPQHPLSHGGGRGGGGGDVPDSFWAWFSREWPLMDWKVGVFLWQTFGGILLVIAVLSIVPGRFHAWSGKILRWPILGLTYALISVELVVYVVIRLGIRVAEVLVATPKHRTLRRKMAQAITYEEWYQYAAALDLSQKRDRWQRQVDDDDASSYHYNWALIKQLIRDMREARDVKHDPMLALAVLQQCTRNNVGGIMSQDLFTKTYTGEPKFLVMEFIGEVTKTLHWVTDQTLAQEEELARTVQLPDLAANAGSNLEAYQKKLEYKTRKERDKVWRSLVALATLNFIGEAKDDDNDVGREKKNNKRDSRYNNNEKDDDQNDCSNRMKDDSPHSPNLQSSLGGHTSPRPDHTTRNAATGSPVDETDWINTSMSNDKEGSAPFSRASSMGTMGSAAAAGTTSYLMRGCHRDQLLTFLKRARAAYGRTALCLSGGAMMGLYHVGHLRGLMETDCLPNIVSGCSAGSVIGAILCTRNNEELARDLDPEVMGPKMKCFERTWPERIVSVWKTGNLFSGDDWLRMIKWFTCGDMTFEEAYRKTGRILCIALAATTKKTPPVLLNYISAPNVTIASAVVASAAVPGFVSPQKLHVKDVDGTVRSAGPETYYDGSIRHDIPTTGLSEMLNCQFFVACQCNPHIVPFFFNPKGGVGQPSRWSSGQQESSWRGGFLLAALEMYLKNDMRAKFVFLRDLDAAVGFTGTMMTQSFEGSTTIVPQVILRDFFTLFSDPSVKSMYRYLQVGTVAAYQHAAMIRLHYRTADALDECIEKIELTSSNQTGNSTDQLPTPTNGSSAALFHKVKVSRRASFDIPKKITKAVVNMHHSPQPPSINQFVMPEIIAAALNERLAETDSTSLSDGSTN